MLEIPLGNSLEFVKLRSEYVSVPVSNTTPKFENIVKLSSLILLINWLPLLSRLINTPFSVSWRSGWSAIPIVESETDTSTKPLLMELIPTPAVGMIKSGNPGRTTWLCSLMIVTFSMLAFTSPGA